MSLSPVTPNDLRDAALAFARRGWPVFPCNPKNKQPLLGNDIDPETREKIKGTGGLKKASCDPEQIRAWWKRWPKALIGVCTGHAERDRDGKAIGGGTFVLDFDPRKDEATGEEWTLEQLRADLEAQMGCALPDSLVSRTQSGGVHVWLRWPADDGAPIRNRGNLPLHVDVRGLGGYVIAPPSVMDSGAAYAWLRERPIVEAPAALIEILRGPKAQPDDAGVSTLPESPASAKLDTNGEKKRPSTERRLPPTDDPQASAQRRYVLAILDRVTGELARTREGGRGEELNRTAFYLGQFVGAGALGRAVAVAALEQAAADNGLAAKDGADRVRDTIERAMTAGEGEPADLSQVGTRAGRTGGSGRQRSAQAGESSGWRDFAPAASATPDPGAGEQGASFHAEGGDLHSSGGAGGADGGRVTCAPDPERDRRCALLPQTDLGNAERFMLRYGDDFRFCPELGWFRWDGRRWALLSEEKDKLPGEVMQAVFLTVRAIAHEADAVAESGFARLPGLRMDRIKLKGRLVQDGLLDVGDDLELIEGDRADPETGEMLPALDFAIKVKANGDVLLLSDTIRAHARASEGKGRLEAIAGLVKSMQRILVRSDAFDVDREAINCMNGTIRIVGGIDNQPIVKLFPHARGDLITKLAAVVYDPGATCEAWDGFFARVQPDAADRRFLDQWAGLSATGDIGFHKMAFHWGKGRNGKSTWTDQIAGILGDYSATISFDSFLEQANKRKGGDATPDLARLPGVRFLRASEPEKGAKLAEGLIKEVTGGEPITARHLNKGFFEFLPSFKLNAQGNYRPKISGTDDGIWGRVRLVPWTVRIPDAEIDPKLPEKLKAERSGIFNRMLAGLIDIKKNGLVESANIKAATAKYREASDALGRFLRDCTEDVAGAREKSSDMFDVFTAWAKAGGGSEWTTQGFAKAMEDRGYERIQSNGIKWLDIRLTVDRADIEAGRFGRGEEDAASPNPPVSGVREPSSSFRGADDDDPDFGDDFYQR